MSSAIFNLQMAASLAVCMRSFRPNLRRFCLRINRRYYFSLPMRQSVDKIQFHSYRIAGIPDLSNNNAPLFSSNTPVPALAMRLSTKNPQASEKPAQSSLLDPYSVVADELSTLTIDIRNELNCRQTELKYLSDYYFDGHGKFIRPTTVILMAQALNASIDQCKKRILPVQRQTALICEMIHTATLVHDDVIDKSNTRRGKASINSIWGQKRATLGGDYIIASAAEMVAKIRNNDVTALFADILSDLVQGEIMQLGTRERENDRFAHYLKKTFKKTASLFANCCKAVAILGGADSSLQQLAYDYGRNLGLAFQLIDDVLDFESTTSVLGKPAAVDLRLGLATGPVLFACEQFPELNSMIMRRFEEPGDVEKALEAVSKSNGLQQTKYLAQSHCTAAINLASSLANCTEQRALCALPELILNRDK